MHRWIAASRAVFVARLAVFAFAALGHCAFLATLCWDLAPGPGFPLVLATPNLLVLAAVIFLRPRVGGLRFGPTMTVVGATAIVGALWTLFQPRASVEELIVRALMAGVGGGGVCGLLGATVATPLILAVERWRAHPAPRRALDVWATLACMASVFAVLRPQGFSSACWDPSGCGLRVVHPVLGRLLLPLDRSLAALALLIAVAVFVLDLGLRRVIARARDGAVEGRRVPLTSEAEAGEAVSLATMHDEAMVAVVGAPGEAGYRDAAPEPVLAAFPRETRVSWRLLAMPAVALICALGLAYVE